MKIFNIHQLSCAIRVEKIAKKRTKIKREVICVRFKNLNDFFKFSQNFFVLIVIDLINLATQ